MATIQGQFDFVGSKVASLYSRQTLTQFVKDDIKVGDLKLSEVVSWSVWNQFSSNPVSGWMSEIDPNITVRA